jgi:hypothetical protein
MYVLRQLNVQSEKNGSAILHVLQEWFERIQSSTWIAVGWARPLRTTKIEGRRNLMLERNYHGP